jgi:hypothetical protein
MPIRSDRLLTAAKTKKFFVSTGYGGENQNLETKLAKAREQARAIHERIKVRSQLARFALCGAVKKTRRVGLLFTTGAFFQRVVFESV